MLPSISFLTGVKATEPRTSAKYHGFSIAIQISLPGSLDLPNKVAKDSDASRNSVVEMALSLSLLTGTSTNDFLRLPNQVPPAG